MRLFLLVSGLLIVAIGILYGRYRFSEDYCPTHFMNMASGSNDVPSINWVADSRAELSGAAPFTTKLKYQLSLPQQEKSCIYMSRIHMTVDFGDGDRQVIFDAERKIGPSEELVLNGHLIEVVHTWRNAGTYQTMLTASAVRSRDQKATQLQTSSPTVNVTSP